MMLSAMQKIIIPIALVILAIIIAIFLPQYIGVTDNRPNMSTYQCGEWSDHSIIGNELKDNVGNSCEFGLISPDETKNYYLQNPAREFSPARSLKFSNCNLIDNFSEPTIVVLDDQNKLYICQNFG
mgnify:CR=1 FL=1